MPYVPTSKEEANRRTKLDRALKKLVRARRRLLLGQGRLARKNARRSFGVLLGKVRSAVDVCYPPVAKEPPAPKLPPAERPRDKPRQIKRGIRFDDKREAVA